MDDDVLACDITEVQMQINTHQNYFSVGSGKWQSSTQYTNNFCPIAEKFHPLHAMFEVTKCFSARQYLKSSGPKNCTFSGFFSYILRMVIYTTTSDKHLMFQHTHLINRYMDDLA
jgi:hypothetical protein